MMLFLLLWIVAGPVVAYPIPACRARMAWPIAWYWQALHMVLFFGVGGPVVWAMVLVMVLDRGVS